MLADAATDWICKNQQLVIRLMLHITVGHMTQNQLRPTPRSRSLPWSKPQTAAPIYPQRHDYYAPSKATSRRGWQGSQTLSDAPLGPASELQATNLQVNLPARELERVLNQTSLLKTQPSRRWSMDSSSCAQRAHSADCWRLWRRRRSPVQHRSCRASLSRGLNYAHVRFQIKITYSMLPNLRQNWVTRPTRTILFWNRSCMIASDVSKLKKRLPVFSLTSQQLQIMLCKFK